MLYEVIPVADRYVLIWWNLVMMTKMPKEIRPLYEVIPVGARYKQLGRPTHFRNGHQNPINEASMMIMAMEMIVILEMMMPLMIILMVMIVKKTKVVMMIKHLMPLPQWPSIRFQLAMILTRFVFCIWANSFGCYSQFRLNCSYWVSELEFESFALLSWENNSFPRWRCLHSHRPVFWCVPCHLGHIYFLPVTC